MGEEGKGGTGSGSSNRPKPGQEERTTAISDPSSSSPSLSPSLPFFSSGSFLKTRVSRGVMWTVKRRE